MPRPPKNGLILNDRSVKGLKPGATRKDYMDLTLRGFGVMVQPTGARSFFVRYRLGRAERRYILGRYPRMTLADARAQAQDALGRVARGEDPQQERREERAAPTFGELAASYLETHAKRLKRSWPEDERILRHDLQPAWGSLSADKIRRADVAHLLDGIVRRGAPIMANRVRALASKVFAFAVERQIVEHNPVDGLRPPGEERKRQRVLTDYEMRTLWAIWEAENSLTSAVFRILLLTAQRLGEVLTMRWQDMDGEWWEIPAGITKNKLAHRIYLADPTRRLLEQVRSRTGSGTWVFASPRTDTHITSVNKAAERYRELSGFQGWHPHDLRRTAATGMGDVEVPDSTIGRVLNHSVQGVTAIYNRSVREREVAHALQAWADRLEEIVHERERADNVVRFR